MRSCPCRSPASILTASIGIIRIDNPPVNALNNALRAALVSILEGARHNAAIEGLVLTCAGRTFIAGADISEFGQPPQRPTTIDVIAAIEQMGKPVVAALFGTPMGGGFEVALGCHFRVAAPGTRVALPEIKLGLMPGAGGTQRLPRLAGMEKALAMILSGDPIDAKDALASGIVDEIADGDVTAAAVAFARRVLAEKRPLTLARDRDEKLAALKRDPSQFEALAAKASRRLGGPVAPARALQALRDAVELAGRKPRWSTSARASWIWSRARNRGHSGIFSSPNAKLRKCLSLRDVKPPDVKACRGDRRRHHGQRHRHVLCQRRHSGDHHRERAGGARRAALATMEKNYQASAARGGLTKDDIARRLALVHPATDLAAVARCRHHRRSGVRGHGRQARGVLGARPIGETGRGARDQHLVSRCECNRGHDRAPGRRRGHALLQPGERDAASGSRARHKDLTAGARDRGRASGARSARRRSWSASVTALSAIACIGSAPSRPSGSCSKAHCRARSMPP